jgi:hypothetical protein
MGECTNKNRKIFLGYQGKLGDISTKLGAFFHKTSGHTGQVQNGVTISCETM